MSLPLGCVCLGVKYGEWKTLERKMEENFFWVCLVRWKGRKINGGTQIFSLWPHQKNFSPKWREKRNEKLDIIFGRQKCPCAIAHELHPRCFSSHIFFLIFFSRCLLFFFPRRCLPFLLFSFFFGFTGQACLVFFFSFAFFCVCVWFFFFRCLEVIFFLLTWFLFF